MSRISMSRAWRNCGKALGEMAGKSSEFGVDKILDGPGMLYESFDEEREANVCGYWRLK